MAGLTTTKPETRFEEMLNTIRDSLSDLASSDQGEDGEEADDREKDPDLGKLSEDDQPSWVMGTISETVQHHLERFWQKQMKLDELTQPGWGDAAEYFHEQDKNHGTTELMVPAVIQPQMENHSTWSGLTTFGELMETLDTIFGISQIPQVTSRPGSSHMRLGSR